MIRQAPTGVAAFVDRFETGPVAEPVSIKSLDEYLETFGPLEENVPGSHAVAQFFENGGKSAWVQRTASDPGTTMLEALVWALDELSRVQFDLLCVPAAAMLDQPTPEARTPDLVTFAQRAARLCAEHRAMLLLDPPPWIEDAATMVRWASANPLADPNAAIWFPRLVGALSGARTGSSGAIAGLISRTDRARGVWKAPAGLTAKLLGVHTASDLGQREVGELNQLGVNSITNHQGGPVSWGARTLAGRAGPGSEWTYVPVRRLALHVETSIRQGLRWRAGEDNGEPLWARLRSEVEEFLQELFRAGALQGTKPGEAYFVKCDSGTTGRSDIADGRVNLHVGLAALKPAEFVGVKVELRRESPPASGSLVSDTVAAALPHLRLRPSSNG